MKLVIHIIVRPFLLKVQGKVRDKVKKKKKKGKRRRLVLSCHMHRERLERPCWHLCACVFSPLYIRNNCSRFGLIKGKQWWWQRWPLRKAFDWRQPRQSNIYQSLIPGLQPHSENVIYQIILQLQTSKGQRVLIEIPPTPPFHLRYSEDCSKERGGLRLTPRLFSGTEWTYSRNVLHEHRAFHFPCCFCWPQSTFSGKP